MFIYLTKLGSNMNKRYYFGIINPFVLGAVPREFGEFIPHPKYPWWKRWKLRITKNMSDIFGV